MCTYVIGVYGNEHLVLGIEPKVDLTMDLTDKVVSTIVRWYNGEW